MTREDVRSFSLQIDEFPTYIKKEATVDDVLNYIVNDVKNVVKNFENKQ